MVIEMGHEYNTFFSFQAHGKAVLLSREDKFWAEIVQVTSKMDII